MLKISLILFTYLFLSLNAYIVERNVKDYGAKGDGVTDDSLAIIRALTEGRASDPNAKYPNAIYPSSTQRPAFVYFPAGTYKITQTLPIVYYTQMVGEYGNVPVLKVVSNDAGQDLRVLEPMGLWYPGVNQDNFYRQIRNFVVDMTQCVKCTGVHWQVAQATSITNVYFKSEIGSENQGLWMENGSGGFISDLVFEGGKFGLWVGNQQFTSRNITIRNTSETAIYLNWDWVWNFQGLTVTNSPVAIDVGDQMGTIILVDSLFENCNIGVRTQFSESAGPKNSLVLDHVTSKNIKTALVMNGATVVLKQEGLIKSWVQGQVWRNSKSKTEILDLSSSAPSRPKILAPNNDKYLQKSRPNYSSSDIINVVKDLGFVSGTDVTQKLKIALTTYANNKVLYFPYGIYIFSDTVYVPPGSRILGQAWSIFMATGNNFQNESSPKPMLKVGNPGEKGLAQISDIIFSTQGPCPGAKLLEWNMADPQNQPGACGIWDVHFRIGGAIGTKIDPSNCPKGDGSKAPPSLCNGVWGLMHITKTGSCYMENVWGWTADHDIDYEDQINVYTARGLLCESQGPVWLYGTAFEHNYLYQYSFVGASNIVMGVIQTETPYFQPSERTPFERTHLLDPTFCQNDIRCKMSLQLNIENSNNIFILGTGLYSFFNTWDQACLQGQPHCQMEMIKITNSKNVYSYAINTYGSVFMLTQAESYSVASIQNNTFCSSSAVNINLF